MAQIFSDCTIYIHFAIIFRRFRANFLLGWDVSPHARPALPQILLTCQNSCGLLLKLMRFVVAVQFVSESFPRTSPAKFQTALVDGVGKTRRAAHARRRLFQSDLRIISQRSSVHPTCHTNSTRAPSLQSLHYHTLQTACPAAASADWLTDTLASDNGPRRRRVLATRHLLGYRLATVCVSCSNFFRYN